MYIFNRLTVLLLYATFSRLQIALFFLFYQHFQPPPPAYVDPIAYFILPNVSTPPPPLFRTPSVYSVHKSSCL